MYPTRLVLKDFGPFESLDYNFEHEPIAVIGENKTQDDQLSNGSGKSFMEQGLFYGIYGTNLRGVLDKKLIREGTDTAYISVRIYCPIRKKSLLIEREIRTKGSATLRMSLIDEREEATPVSFATVLDGNEYIANWVEITAEDAKSYYIVTKGNYKSFFSSSNTEKLALISRFINFSQVDQTKSVIESNVSKINASKQTLINEKSNLEGRLSVYKDQLERELSRDLAKEKEMRIEAQLNRIQEKLESIENIEKEEKQVKNRINEIDGEIQEKESALNEVQQNLTEARKADSFESIYKEIEEDTAEYNSQRERNQNELERIDKNLRQFSREIKNCEIILAGVIECPKCHHRFVLDSNNSVEEVEKRKASIEKEATANSAEAKKIQAQLDDIQSVLNEYAALKRDTRAQESEVLGEISSLQRKVSSVESSINSLKIERQTLEERVNVTLKQRKASWMEIIDQEEQRLKEIEAQVIEEVNTKEFEANITKAEKEIKIKDTQILDEENKIVKIQRWIQRFKDFKMFLAMEQIKNIQTSANEILKLMGSDLRLMIEGFKLDSKGKAKEEITPYVFRDEMESFFYYSGGEQARVEIALILALQQMINSTKEYGGLQFLLCDETLDACDALGLENIIASMGFLKQSVMIISHIPKINEEIRQIKITKENGVSRLVI